MFLMRNKENRWPQFELNISYTSTTAESGCTLLYVHSSFTIILKGKASLLLCLVLVEQKTSKKSLI